MCNNTLEAIIPYLNVLTKNISIVHLDSAVRPVAKLCKLLTKVYYSKADSKNKTNLNETHKESIIEARFDWMINDEKIAPKAYSMNSLFLLAITSGYVYNNTSSVR